MPTSPRTDTASRARPDDPVPPVRGLGALREAARTCQACPLYRHATQTVFGEGPARARAVLVGEQPGNDEDLAGAPFVGPAGRVLKAVLEELGVELGVERKSLYLTNAVKHFKFVTQGKRRLHQKPKGLEIKACKPWLVAELERLKPEVVVALGAVAASALFGPAVSVTRDRGRVIPSTLASRCFVTYHPSAALRGITPADRARVREALRADLRTALSTVLPLRQVHATGDGRPEFSPPRGKTSKK